MQIQKNISLKNFNTFGIEAKAAYFGEIKNPNDIISYMENPEVNDKRCIVIGGGSNMLLTKDFEGIVLFNNIKGIKYYESDYNEFLAEANAGEVWHDLVTECVDKGFYGIENLALIPGKVGAAPVQNIGAYGVEQQEAFYYVEGINLESGKNIKLYTADCGFGYRDSIFKKELKDKFIITKVVYKLKKRGELNISYRDIKVELDNQNVTNPDLRWVYDTVVKVRRRKLHDPKDMGNCGSFFKNPIIEELKFEELKSDYPDIPGYEAPDNKIKLSAAWLIEKCGWKGKRLNDNSDAAVSPKHSLVLVNLGKATGLELKTLAYNIIDSVKQKFDIDLYPEVNIIE